MRREGGTADRQPGPGPPSRMRPPRLAPDAELVARAHSGCDAAFEELSRRHRPALLRQCTRLVGPDLGEDAVQETFVKALVTLRGDAAPPAEMRAWLLRVARNASIDMLRRRALESGAAPAAAPVAAGGEPHDVLERRRELRSVVREIGRLPERQRQALLLRAVEGHGYEQIAGALDASEGMVRQLIYRARETVRSAAAAILFPTWLLRLARRSVSSAHGAAAAGGGALAGGGAAVKMGALVTAAGLVLGGVTITHHGHAGGPETAHAAPQPEVAKHAPSRQRPHARAADRAAHPHHQRALHRTPAGRHRARAVQVDRSAPRTAPVVTAPPARPTGGDAPVPPRADGVTAAPPPGQSTPTGPRPTGSSPPSHDNGGRAPTGPDRTPTTPERPPVTPEPPAPTRPPAPDTAGHVVRYEQSPGFGGPLTIERSSGEQVGAYFGELVVLSCYFVRDGRVVEHATCTKERLQPGTAVAFAEHRVNDSGHDVWTRIDLIVPAG